MIVFPLVIISQSSISTTNRNILLLTTILAIAPLGLSIEHAFVSLKQRPDLDFAISTAQVCVCEALDRIWPIPRVLIWHI
jgi:hypothetical protein